MSSIFGWTNLADRTPNAGPPSLESRGYSGIAGPAGSVYTDTPQAGRIHQDGGLISAICGEPRWSDARPGERSEPGFAQGLIAAYRKDGPTCLGRIHGPFALAIMDADTGESILAADRMGIHSLTYTLVDGIFVFGSDSDLINLHPMAHREVAVQSLYNYLFFHMVPGETSIYQDRHRLAPGCYAHFRNGTLTVHKYWEMVFIEDDGAGIEDLSREFNRLVRDGVAESLSEGKTGAFLSGGTDSSTVSGLLGEIQGTPAHTYSIGFDVDGYDETEFARIAVRHFGTVHHEYRVTSADVVAAIPRVAAAYDQPFGNASAVPTWYCARMAREDGVQRVLGGDGGDELFGGNVRYARQRRFSLYEGVPRFLRTGLLEPVLCNLPDTTSVPLLGKARRYVRQARVPMPERMETHNLVNHFGAGNMLTAEALTRVDLAAPSRLSREIYQGARAQSLINRMLALDFRLTLADNDLRKVTRMCELAGVEVGFPLLDDRLVEFSGRVPPDLKLRGTQLRYLFKYALKDFLPPEIIAKKKHGFGLPFGAWLATDPDLREIAYGSLSDFRQRRVLRPEFLNGLQQHDLARHASYYGTMIWIVMMLEQWFKVRAPRWGL